MKISNLKIVGLGVLGGLLFWGNVAWADTKNPLEDRNPEKWPFRVQLIDELVDSFIKGGDDVRNATVQERMNKAIEKNIVKLDPTKKPDLRTTQALTALAIQESKKIFNKRLDEVSAETVAKIKKKYKAFEVGEEVTVHYVSTGTPYVKTGRYGGVISESAKIKVGYDNIFIRELSTPDAFLISEAALNHYANTQAEKASARYDQQRREHYSICMTTLKNDQRRQNEKLGYTELDNVWYTPSQILEFVVALKPMYVKPDPTQKISTVNMKPEEIRALKLKLLAEHVTRQKNNWAPSTALPVDRISGPDSLAWGMTMGQVRAFLPLQWQVSGQILTCESYRDPRVNSECRLTLTFKRNELDAFSKTFKHVKTSKVSFLYAQLRQLIQIPDANDNQLSPGARIKWTGKKVNVIFTVSLEDQDMNEVRIDCYRAE